MAWSSLPSPSQSDTPTQGRLTAGRDCFTEPQEKSGKQSKNIVHSGFYCEVVWAFLSHIVSGRLLMADLKHVFQAPLERFCR